MFELPEIVSQMVPLIPEDAHIYLIGGAVRDLVLRRPFEDLDFVVTHQTRTVAAGFANLVDGDIFTLDEERKIYRVLGKTAHGNRQAFDFAQMRGENLEADLRDRDFTINAMAVDIQNSANIIDPLHGGMDLRQKSLQTCSPDSFVNDPVRVIRAVRYAVSYGLRIEQKVKVSLLDAVPLLADVSAERKRDELLKILAGSDVGTALDVLLRFRIINAFGHLTIGEQGSIFRLVDELSDLLETVCGVSTSVKGQNIFHSALLIQLGRFRKRLFEHFYTPNQSDRIIKTLTLLGAILSSMVDKDRVSFLKGLALSTEEFQRVLKCSVRTTSEGTLQERISNDKRSIYRYFKEFDAVGVDLIFIKLAEFRARPAAESSQDEWLKLLGWADCLLTAWFEQPEIARPVALINGADIMHILNIQPGPQVGELLEGLLEEQASGKIETADQAADWVRKHKE